MKLKILVKTKVHVSSMVAAEMSVGNPTHSCHYGIVSNAQRVGIFCREVSRWFSGVFLCVIGVL
jgi:hypothetical protein